MNSKKLPFVAINEIEAKRIIDSLNQEYQLFLESRDENWVTSAVEHHSNKINLLKEEYMGSADHAIKVLRQTHIEKIERLYADIIDIHRSNLNVAQQKHFIGKLQQELELYIENNTYNIYFEFPKELIEDLNDIHLYYEWIEKDDDFLIRLSLEAYMKIEHYSQWAKKNKIEDKRFREKIDILYKNYMELKEKGIIHINHISNFPSHPQDIIHDLVDNYKEFYGKDIDDQGVQTIIKIISDYTQRMPKKSKNRKAKEKKQREIYNEAQKLRENGATKEEVTAFIILKTYGKAITYTGNEEPN